eukprot:Gb_09923 [translate_table: standard]
MYAIGKLISQGVYTVAGPFHPFGGAVDIIVVQQEDATFKSTPWYVKFGKFQGVLKRSEKIVTVAVNGVEANFHMYLDNTGEAYFLKEVESDEEEIVFSPGSSSSFGDETMVDSRRESFKSAEAHEDIDGQDEEMSDSDRDNQIYNNEKKALLDLLSSDSIENVSQSNGEILISFSKHNTGSSDMKTVNGFWNDSSKPSFIDECNDKEPLEMPFKPVSSELQATPDITVESAFPPSEYTSSQQDSSLVRPLVGGLTNANALPKAHNPPESSLMENIGDTDMKLYQSVGQTEYLGRGSEQRWYSQTEASVFTVEGSSGAYNMFEEQSSSNEGVLLSGYRAYDYENMDLPQLGDVSDLMKLENGNSEVVIMSVDGHVMTAPISPFKSSGSVDLHKSELDLVGDQDACIESEGINLMQQVMDASSEYRTNDYELVSKEIIGQQKAQEDTGGINFSDNLAENGANSMSEGSLQNQYDSSISSCLHDLEVEYKQVRWSTNKMDKIEKESECKNLGIEPDEYCLQTKNVDVCEMARINSSEELEFTFNDEDIFKSCLALSDLSPPTGEEEKECSLSPHMEEEEKECHLDGSSKNSDESSSIAFHLIKHQACHAESSYLLEMADATKMGNLGGSPSSMHKTQTSSIHVPGVHLKGRGVFAQASGSLPNIGSHFSDSETSRTMGLFSHSLDIDSAINKRAMNHDMLSTKSQNKQSYACEKKTVQGGMIETSGMQNLSGRETLISGVQQDMGIDIEISLCRHLLFEGMGTEAAIQAFDSEKVSREEFSGSGTEILKNERLVVRIRDRYFPWYVAGPIILGMVAFGLEAPVEPAGEIKVERSERMGANKYASNPSVSSGGVWRIWPFSFRRPKTPERSSSARPASNGELMVEPGAALQSSSDKALAIKNGYRRRPHKHVRTNTLTSEQLASLNLKEGQNIITFTFLTSVLGKQQVDARIYLWKWNTRIVVSDVDGTITKSDVLGQVMPLVGKDWTQTGVARLFSAIKDNGYQLLFLSARAISQAYLTRQFLLNLKQDGKALPDGPVVISPDGLFPSLYREGDTKGSPRVQDCMP